MKKKLAVLAVLLALAFTLGACGGGGGGGYNAENIYVSLYIGGVGREWLDELAAEYNGTHDGADVVVQPGKTEYATIRDELRAGTSKVDVYFSDVVQLEELVYLDLLADISDIMDDKIGEENESILEKMSDSQKKFYNYGTESEPVYYALPYQETPCGIVYDHDLFVARGFLDGGPGPDGKTGTVDDGLPQTYDDFKELLRTMVKSGVTPFAWTSEYEFYTGFVLRSIWAQYEGVNDFDLNYTFEGTDEQLGEITPQTGWKLFQQEGLHQALKFVEECMIPEGYATEGSFKRTSHTVTQDRFILSELTDTPTAMIMTGSWWENESKGTFLSAYKEYGTRDFRLLPLPKFDGQKGYKEDGTGSAFFNWNDNTAIFVNKQTKHLDDVKEFLKFMHTDYALSKFTVATNCLRALDYSLTEDQYKQLTKFGQNVWTLAKESDNIEIVGKNSRSPLINFTSPMLDNYRFDATINGAPYSWPASAMHDNASITADIYWQGIQTKYSEAQWATIYDSVKNYFS